MSAVPNISKQHEPIKSKIGLNNKLKFTDRKNMTKNTKLMLVEIKEIKFKDKETGEQLQKFKYVFFNENNEPVVGYADTKVFEERVRPAEKYVSTEAFSYTMHGSLWEDKVTWRVAVE